MENNGILEIYVKDKKLNKKDYELICSALKENKNILVGTKFSRFEWKSRFMYLF